MTNQTLTNKTTLQQLFCVPVIVAALGYFVDIYDLLLFGIVRLPSLKSLGLNDEQVSIIGTQILNWQMTGLLLGGIFWGILGDKKGRLSVLFGSIITYSLANIACGFVQDVEIYKILRFIAGIGLAGELGAGITLVTEILPKKLRAIGTSLVAGIGLLGAIVGFLTVQYFDWRTAYFVGGALGIALLLLRIGVFESKNFTDIKNDKTISKGNILMLFNTKTRLQKYLRCIGIGIPTWFVIGILATFSNEFGTQLGLDIQPGKSIMWCYVGLSAGDFVSGFISNYFQSRKKAVLILMVFALICAIIILTKNIHTTEMFYTFCTLMGFGIGYWALFVTIGAEQFGTNIRATATTTIPNFVRGTVVLMTLSFASLKNIVSVNNAGLILGLICFAIGIYCTITIPETIDKNLDYLEK